MRIDEIRKIYASLMHATVPEKKTEIEADPGTADNRDSYIPGVGGGETVQSTGNYDDQGQMDDDFSISVGDGNDNGFQAAQYSREYAQQTMHTVAKPETPGDGMGRPQ